MTKMKQVTYASLPYMSKLAACMYPDKVPEHIQQEMLKISDGWVAGLRYSGASTKEMLMLGR